MDVLKVVDHPAPADAVLLPTMKGMGMKELLVHVTVLEAQKPRPLLGDGSLRRGKAKTVKFQLVLQVTLKIREKASILCNIKFRDDLVGHRKLHLDVSHLASKVNRMLCVGDVAFHNRVRKAIQRAQKRLEMESPLGGQQLRGTVNISGNFFFDKGWILLARNGSSR